MNYRIFRVKPARVITDINYLILLDKFEEKMSGLRREIKIH